MVEIINPIQYPYWDKIMSQNPASNIFYSSNWARVLVNTYKFKPVYLCSFQDKCLNLSVPIFEIKSLIGGTYGVSMPFTDFVSPITPKKFRSFFATVKAFGKKRGWKFIKVNGWDIDLGGASLSPSYAYEHRLSLDQDASKVKSRFKSNTKRNINKALKSDLKAFENNSYEGIVEYYKLHCVTRKSHGLPPQPFSFFENIFNYIIAEGNGMILLVEHGNRSVAGAILFHFGVNAIYKYGASRKEYQHLRPNNLVMWSAIERYCKRGFKSFSFGITHHENRGLRRFKKGWDVQEKKIFIFTYDYKNDNFTRPKSLVYGNHNFLFSKLPVSLSRAIGTLLYKYAM